MFLDIDDVKKCIEDRGVGITLTPIPNDAITIVDSKKKEGDINKFFKENNCASEAFKKGSLLKLRGEQCDGFSMKEKVYEVVGNVKEYHGTPINSLIVKQVGGEQGVIYTLSKNDCREIGIEYEKGLQLFPTTMKWISANDTVEFNPSDITTYGKTKDGKLTVVALEFSLPIYEKNHVLLPNKKVMKVLDLSFRATSKIKVDGKSKRFTNTCKCIGSMNEERTLMLISLYIGVDNKYLDMLSECGVSFKGVSALDIWDICVVENDAFTIKQFENYKKWCNTTMKNSVTTFSTLISNPFEEFSDPPQYFKKLERKLDELEKTLQYYNV